MPPEMTWLPCTSRPACHRTSRSSRTVDGDTVRPADYWPSRHWDTSGSGSTTDLGQNGVPNRSCPSRSLPHRPFSREQSRSLVSASEGALRVTSVLTTSGPATPNKPFDPTRYLPRLRLGRLRAGQRRRWAGTSATPEEVHAYHRMADILRYSGRCAPSGVCGICAWADVGDHVAVEGVGRCRRDSRGCRAISACV